MSFLYFGNVPASVPPVFDTTPCMKEMLQYEDCVFDANVPQKEVFHPNWPTVWPRLLTDGKTVEVNPEDIVYQHPSEYMYLRPLTKKNKNFLWECEEERFVYKACLRKLSTLQRSNKHTSWDTAQVSTLMLT
ncbi:hypothetical protein DAPPUDRAFT_274183 [Daphnia pulex]|uniref:Uncharacterized protein n=1 Tax=Daphnia pulex TaxID=6669 RepID=E9I3Z0_DAPPU|nr:hypothetical protein DAPPUDRAFT_274183 [Daphnia pulex]|eukprot:EFX61291.1 hypothetical protein DAPPUDRAFT_274183 [Daphnia pulex]